MANNGPVKKVPERMCTGCKVHKPKKELIRVVKAPDGEISVDFHGKKSGRGAYVCNDLYYALMQMQEKLGCKGLFIHVPPQSAMASEKVAETLEICLQTILG